MTSQTYATNNLMETFIGKDGKEHTVYLAVKVTAYGVSPRTTNNITGIALADDIEIEEDRFFLDPVFNEDDEVIDSAAESKELYFGAEKEEVLEDESRYGFRFAFNDGSNYVDNSVWYDYDQDAKSVAEELELGVTSDDPFNSWEGAYASLTNDLDFIGEVLEYRKEKPETYFYVEGDGRFLD